MHDTLNSERFVDQAPTEVYATLLDEGQYLCSVRTMYRILEEHAEAARAARSAPPPKLRKAGPSGDGNQPGLVLYREVLDILMQTNGLFYKSVGSTSVLVHPRKLTRATPHIC